MHVVLIKEDVHISEVSLESLRGTPVINDAGEDNDIVRLCVETSNARAL